jgi:hypothetical protein
VAQQFDPNRISGGTLTLDNGDVVTFTGAELQGWMQQRGVTVSQLADGTQAAIGLLEKMDINGFIDDERDARANLLEANTKILAYWTKKDPQYADMLRAQLQAQENLDEAQTQIGRSLDRAVLVASGSAAAKAIFADRIGSGSYAGGMGGAGGLALGVLGGYGAFKLLEDDRGDRSSRRSRRALGPSTTPPG